MDTMQIHMVKWVGDEKEFASFQTVWATWIHMVGAKSKFSTIGHMNTYSGRANYDLVK